MKKPNYDRECLVKLYDRVSPFYRKTFLEKEHSATFTGDDYEYAQLIAEIGDDAGVSVHHYFCVALSALQGGYGSDVGYLFSNALET